MLETSTLGGRRRDEDTISPRSASRRPTFLSGFLLPSPLYLSLANLFLFTLALYSNNPTPPQTGSDPLITITLLSTSSLGVVREIMGNFQKAELPQGLLAIEDLPQIGRRLSIVIMIGWRLFVCLLSRFISSTLSPHEEHCP